MDRNRLILVEILESSEEPLGKDRRKRVFYNARIAKVKEVSERVRRTFPYKQGQFQHTTNIGISSLVEQLETKIDEMREDLEEKVK